MSSLTLSDASTEYVKVPVAATVNGAAVDPSGDAVYLAFLADEAVSPVGGDWHVGSWETAGTSYLARCLVGPANGGVVLAAGLYVVWVKVTDNPEVPVQVAGKLRVLEGAFR